MVGEDGPALTGMTQQISNFANSFLDNMGALFLMFGVALVTIGASVRVSREYQVSQIEACPVDSSQIPLADGRQDHLAAQ